MKITAQLSFMGKITILKMPVYIKKKFFFCVCIERRPKAQNVTALSQS